MLGDILAEETGRVIGQRVLPAGAGPRIEVTFEANGRLLGSVEAYDRGTYTAEVQPDGSIFAEGQGVVVTPEGMVTWTGSGVGHMNTNAGAIGGYTVGYRGAISYRTAAPALARLNGVCAVFEYDVDGANNTTARVWEWK